MNVNNFIILLLRRSNYLLDSNRVPGVFLERTEKIHTHTYRVNRFLDISKRLKFCRTIFHRFEP